MTSSRVVALADDDMPPEGGTFDGSWYLQAHADVRASGLDPWEHYLQHGRGEGRLGAPLQALDLDLLLWRGHAALALPALEALLQHGPWGERAAAGWVLARWYLDHQAQDPGALQAAHAAIMVFHAAPAMAQVPGHPGPWLLGVQLCVARGDLAAAQAILLAGLRRFGPLPDFQLADFLCRKARGADLCALNDLLAGLYQPHRLLPVELVDLAGPRFDRLSVDAGPQRRAAPAGPVVSVIVPMFNAAAVLGTTLRALQAQSWSALEILLVDDGSQDDSLALAHRLAAQDPRIRVLEGGQQHRGGGAVARNAGLAAATGRFVTVLEAGDWAHRQRIEMQLRPLVREPGLQATLSDGVRADGDLNLTHWRLEESWICRNPASLMFRSALRDSLGFWDRVQADVDAEYCARIAAAYGAQAVRPVLPGTPLSFGRVMGAAEAGAEGALAPRNLLSGPRKAYLAAARAWHARATQPADLHLPQEPALRPFRVPPALSLGDPEPPPGPVEVLAGSALFDACWYEMSNPDVLRAGLDPVRHYLESGARENRDPGPGFSSGGYRRAMGLGPAENPLLHYEARGRLWDAAPLPGLRGALADRLTGGVVPHLVFAHSSGKTLFGAERSLLDVLARMAGRGEAAVVVLPALQNPDYLERLLAVSAGVEFAPQLWRHDLRVPHPQTVAHLRGLIRRHGVRQIHVNTIVLDAPLAAARAEGVQSVVHVRELPAEDPALCRTLGTDATRLRAHLLDEADRFIVTSQLVADWLACPDRTEIRPNSVDPALFDLPFAPGPALRVAIVSSNIAKKGLADFLAVARIVHAERPGIRFLIFGPPTADLHQMQPFAPNVEFRGYAETPLAAMAEADVVMSLSKFAESFGRTVMEAMAAGRPVVCYDRGAPPSLLSNGQNGFVVPADDIATAAVAVMALDVARGRLAGFSQAARESARALQAQALKL